nr:hypothetical protein Iba_chr09fCG12840 [Ipomoea batatas]
MGGPSSSTAAAAAWPNGRKRRRRENRQRPPLAATAWPIGEERTAEPCRCLCRWRRRRRRELRADADDRGVLPLSSYERRRRCPAVDHLHQLLSPRNCNRDSKVYACCWMMTDDLFTASSLSSSITELHHYEDVKEGCCCCAPSYIDTVTAHRRKTIVGLPRRATAQVERRMEARSCHPSSCTAGSRTGRVYRWAPPLLPNGGGKGAALLPCTPSEGKPPSFIQPENGRNRERRPCCYSIVPPEGKPDAKLCRDPSLVARRRRETRWTGEVAHCRWRSRTARWMTTPHRACCQPPWPPSTITASNATTQTPEKEGLLPLLPLTAATARSRRTESDERERGDSACGRWPNGEERTVEAVRYPSLPRTGEAGRTAIAELLTPSQVVNPMKLAGWDDGSLVLCRRLATSKLCHGCHVMPPGRRDDAVAAPCSVKLPSTGEGRQGCRSPHCGYHPSMSLWPRVTREAEAEAERMEVRCRL